MRVFVFLLLFFPHFLSAEPVNKVEIPPQASDSAIEERLQKLMAVTQWFPKVELEVNQGLAIFEGEVETEKRREWLLALAEKTDGVVAVIDRLELSVPEAKVFEPALLEVQSLSERSLKKIPYIVSAILVILLTLLLAFFLRSSVRRMLRDRGNTLLAQAISNVALLLSLALGLYLALNMTGLSGLAFTVLGGTGIFGIGIGLALKSTFENYVAGIMISMRQIFRKGELISLLGHTGIVQAVTTRSTSIMDFEGNNVTIPNSEVFSATIRNFTRNPNMRLDFNVGIGYDDSIEEARAVISETLNSLEGVILLDPEYIVAVDSLGAATVNLRVYFWFNAARFSHVKVKSVVIENVKEALMRAEISMPDDAREVVFTSPLEIVRHREDQTEVASKSAKSTVKAKDVGKASEDLKNETSELQKQAELTGSMESGSNLLKN